MQALAWCGKWCGLPNPYCSYCAFSGCYAHQISAKTDLCEHRTKAVFDLKLYLVGLSIKLYLPRVGSGLIVRLWIGA